MITDPTIRTRTIPKGIDGNRVALTFDVQGGLHYITGNAAPYFSLTYWEHRKGHPGQCEGGGAGHEKILRYYPELADLAALHLSDIDGVPTHAEANGWYWLAGALGGLNEKYHGGNNGQNLDGARLLEIFAEHCRISLTEAMDIARRVRAAVVRASSGYIMDAAPARAVWAAECEAMRPRWKLEAEACIKKHDLKIYGDPWDPRCDVCRESPAEYVTTTHHLTMDAHGATVLAPHVRTRKEAA